MATVNKTPFNEIVDDMDMQVSRPANRIKKEVSLTDLEHRQKTLAQIYSTQKKYPVRIAPSYAKHFGNIMRVVINGIAIAVRCNGITYNVPEEYAAEIERRMHAIDEMDMKSRKMSNIKNNYEPDIGRLNFF